MSQPLVSVVMITYNHEKYIEEAINGVLLQNYDGPIELIIANDNSPDNTDEVIEKILFANSNNQNIEIKYTKHSENKGVMLNFIWALKQVRGKYIALCEGDDYWTNPSKLEIQVGFLEANENYGLVHMNYNTLNNGIINSRNYRIRDDEYDYYLETGDIRTLSACFRSQFLNPFFSLLDNNQFMHDVVAGDRPLFISIGQYSQIYFINIVCGIYREDSISSVSNFKNLKKDLLFKKKISELNMKLFDYYNIEKFQRKNKDSLLYYNTILEHKCNIIRVFKAFFKGNIRVNYYKSYIQLLIRFKRANDSFCNL